MKNVEFENETIKESYQEIIKKHRALAPIILKLADENIGIKIEVIEHNDKGISIIASRGIDELHTYINLDLLKKRIMVNNQKGYVDVYIDAPVKYNKPIAKQYEMNEKILYETLTYNLSNDESIKYYQLKVENETYTIIIDKCNPLHVDDKGIANLLINNQYRFRTIRELFLYLKGNYITNFFDIKLADSKGSTIIINKGIVTTYLEYIEKEDEFVKVYMENGEFFSESKVKKQYHDEIVPFIKNMNKIISRLDNR